MKPENISLKVIHGPFKGHTFPLHRGPISIGREPRNEIPIPDRTVSKKHAIISYIDVDDQMIIKDVSTNGTRVDGERISEKVLQPNAKIEIGPCIFEICEATTEVPVTEETFKDEELLDQDEDESHTDLDHNEKKKSLFKSPLGIIVIGLVAGILIVGLLAKSQKGKKPVPITATTKNSIKHIQVVVPDGTISGQVPPTVLKEAESLFKAAEKYYSENYINVNLYEAINRWEKGINLLANYRNRPAMFNEQVSKLKAAKMDLQKRFDENMFNVKITLQRGEYNLALRHLQVILESIPDNLDERYMEAKRQETRVKKLVEKT